MMKKIRIILLLFILTFSFSVKAEASMEIDCSSNEVTDKSAITCSGNLVYEEVYIDDVELEYATNLDIEFLTVSGFTLNHSGNKIIIHSSTTLYDDITNSEVIMKFTLKANNNSNEEESITLKNIKIKNSTDIINNVSKTFKVTVDKVLDNDSTLKSITIDGVSVNGFAKDKLEYKNIEINKNVIKIDATRSSEKASATGLGDVFVKPGESIQHDIVVTAEDKTQTVYKLFITNKNSESSSDEETNSVGLELSKDNTLKSLELYNGKEKIPFKFDSTKDTFNITIENSELKKITIKATVNHNKATFINDFGPRDVNVSLGNNKVLIKVKAENKDEKVYTLNINLKESKSNDNTLSLLKICDEEIKLVDEVYTYEVTVDKDISKTKIEALANSEKAKVEFKDIDLTSGKNEVVIKVTAEDNSKKEYRITIIRSDKSKVKDLKITGYNLGFTNKQKEYILKINKDDSKLEISLDPSDVKYEISGNENLVDGSIIKLTIEDADGVNEYKITILKDDNKMNVVVLGAIILLITIVTVGIIYIIKKRKKKPIEDYDVI